MPFYSKVFASVLRRSFVTLNIIIGITILILKYYTVTLRRIKKEVEIINIYINVYFYFINILLSLFVPLFHLSAKKPLIIL